MLYCVSSHAQHIKKPHAHALNQVIFTENKSQWDLKVAYRAQLDGGALFIEKNGNLKYHLYDKDDFRLRHIGKSKSDKLKFHAYSVNFLNANPFPQTIGENPSSDYVNYFIGNNPAKWAANINQYHELWIKELYPGIDIQYVGGPQSIKYTFIVRPGADVKQIQLEYKDVSEIKLKNGALHISTSVSNAIEQQPFVYQVLNGDTVIIPTRFELKSNVVSFKLLKKHDPARDLIIDPLLVFAASSGSTADNFGMTATYDSRGSLYSGGTAFNIGYPTTPGAYDLSYNGSAINGFTDVVITKYDSTGTFLKYSTYLGGATASEIVTSLIVDKNDNLCLYGATGSSEFPTTPGCFDNSFNGGTPINFVFNGTNFTNGTDIYVAKFNSSGNTLLSSTYIGGSENDGINYNNVIATYNTPFGLITEYPPDSLQYNYGDQYRGEIQIDSLDNVYICSSTKSSDFPTQNAIDNTLGGRQDAVLIKLNPSFGSLVFSTYIGGSDNDAGYALALDDTLNIYITGGTRSADFPTTPGSYKPLYGAGKCDGYVCKIKSNGSAISHASYIGTSDYDQSYFVQLDNQQNVYLYGQSLGTMPVTAGVFSVGNSKQFIQKLNPQLSTLLASTIFGNGNGAINISPSAFSVDCAGNVYLSGWGGNIIFGNATNGMPITGNAIQPSTDGFNFYLMVLGPNMGNILFGSYFGGALSREHVDGGTSRFDKKGIIYQSVCAGCGGNDDFPVTPGAWPNTPGNPNHNTDNNNCNNGVFKIDFQLNTAVANISSSALSGCAPLTVTLTNNSTPGHDYLWDFGGNDTTSTINNPVKMFSSPGTYSVNLYVKTSICNNLYDTAQIVINVLPTPVADFTITVDSCSNKVSFINQTSPSGIPAKWYVNGSQFSTQNNPNYSFFTGGTYTIALVSQAGASCKDSVVKTIIVPVDSARLSSLPPKCSYETGTLYAGGGISYSWTPSAGLLSTNSFSAVCNATTSTIYSVTITQNSLFGKTCIKTLTTSVVVYPIINSAFTYSVGACGNNVQFTDASTITPVSWSWNFGNLNGSSLQNPLEYYSAPGNYTVSLIAVNAQGCKDTSYQVLNLTGFDPISVNPGIFKCESDTVQLLATGGDVYLWTPSAGLSNPNIANPLAFPSTSTIYTVNISNINGTDTCKSILSTQVGVLPFAYNTNSISVSSTSLTVGQTVTVTLNGFTETGVISVVPLIPLNAIGTNQYQLTPPKSGEYSIYFTDASGCRHLLKTLYVEVVTDACNEDVVYLPTGFTPNNDGVNDILLIRSNFVTEVYLTIYNRWGEKLFETNDIKKGWDGMFKGKLLDQGVYGYYMTFTCNNGEKSFKKGNITLMR